MLHFPAELCSFIFVIRLCNFFLIERYWILFRGSYVIAFFRIEFNYIIFMFWNYIILIFQNYITLVFENCITLFFGNCIIFVANYIVLFSRNIIHYFSWSILYYFLKEKYYLNYFWKAPAEYKPQPGEVLIGPRCCRSGAWMRQPRDILVSQDHVSLRLASADTYLAPKII